MDAIVPTRPDRANVKSFISAEDHSDNMLASCFVDSVCEKILYVPEFGQYLTWTGQRWEIDQDANRVLGMARDYCRSLFKELKSSKRSDRDVAALGRTILKANSAASLRAIVALSKADKRIATTPDDLDAYHTRINLPNGTLDLNSRELCKHLQDDRMTLLAGVDYDPEATCPMWEELIRTIWEDEDTRKYVQALLGYCLSGESGWQVLPMFVGPGGNGKGTIMEVMNGVLKDYFALSNEGLCVGVKRGHETEIARLNRKRMVSCNEPERNEPLRESRIKQFTGDSRLTGRGMFEEHFEFDRTFKTFISANHTPTIAGRDEGIWRRVKLIPTPHKLKDRVAIILDYGKKLLREEGSGILNWLLDGWDARHMSEPASVLTATKSYRSEQDDFETFLAENCERRQGAEVPIKYLQASYIEEWGASTNSKAFRQTVLDSGFTIKKSTVGQYRGKSCVQNLAFAIEKNVGGLPPDSTEFPYGN